MLGGGLAQPAAAGDNIVSNSTTWMSSSFIDGSSYSMRARAWRRESNDAGLRTTSGITLENVLGGLSATVGAWVSAPFLVLWPSSIGEEWPDGYPEELRRPIYSEANVSPDIGAPSGPQINEGQQGKHIPGHNNHTPGRSELTDPDPQGLLDGHAGTGQQVGPAPAGQPGSKERVDFGKNIGNYVDPVTGVKTPTTKGIIHYGSRGAHIVPARP